MDLGYIPCKNYMDKKICSSVIRKTSKLSSFKSFKENTFQFISSAGGKEIDLFGSRFSVSDSILFTSNNNYSTDVIWPVDLNFFSSKYYA